MYGDDNQVVGTLIDQLIDLLNNKCEESLTKGWCINAIAKLSSANAFDDDNKVDSVFKQYATSKNVEIQQRCKEYLYLKPQRKGLIKN